MRCQSDWRLEYGRFCGFGVHFWLKLMFKFSEHGHNKLSMSFIIIIFLALMGGVGFAMDMDNSTLNNYLYGPYLRDSIIQERQNDGLIQFKKKVRCNQALLSALHKEFFKPGIFEKVMGHEDAKNIMACSWLNQPKGNVLMEKLVYARQLTAEATTKNRMIRDVIYHPEFIMHVARYHPKIMAAIPDSHPDYLRISVALVKKLPIVFNDITLRYKRHPAITQALFDAKPTYDDIYKHMAIQHTLSEHQRKKFIMHNGLLYLELPKEVRDNPYLAYHAYVQNDFVYPYIPQRIIDVFKANDTIMVPRYMTLVTLFKQKIWRAIGVAIAPIKDIFRSTDTDDQVAVTIDNADDASSADTPIDDDLVLDASQSDPEVADSEIADETALFDTIDFKNERTVVTDIRIINKIEMKKKRRLLNLWRIAKFGDDGQVFVAMFRPNGKDHLGTIVVKQKERFMFSDYAAVFSMDGESIWRINDGGTFSAASFVLDGVKKSPEGQLNFSFSWKGDATINQFNLVDDGGILVKEFINYYFE